MALTFPIGGGKRSLSGFLLRIVSLPFPISFGGELSKKPVSTPRK
jgi:hypothetical protein